MGSSSIGMDNTGNFVITWSNRDAGIWEVYAQRFDASGNLVGTEFQVNSYTDGKQGEPSIAMNDDGSFVITWHSAGQDGSDFGIYAQRFNSSGSAVGTEFQVNSYSDGKQETPSITMDDTGRFVITWQSNGQDGSDYGVFAQRFDTNGNKVDSEFQVNSYTLDDQKCPSIAMDNNGRFVITWQSDGQDGSCWGVYAKRFSWDLYYQCE